MMTRWLRSRSYNTPSPLGKVVTYLALGFWAFLILFPLYWLIVKFPSGCAPALAGAEGGGVIGSRDGYRHPSHHRCRMENRVREAHRGADAHHRRRRQTRAPDRDRIRAGATEGRGSPRNRFARNRPTPSSHGHRADAAARVQDPERDDLELGERVITVSAVTLPSV